MKVLFGIIGSLALVSGGAAAVFCGYGPCGDSTGCEVPAAVEPAAQAVSETQLPDDCCPSLQAPAASSVADNAPEGCCPVEADPCEGEVAETVALPAVLAADDCGAGECGADACDDPAPGFVADAVAASPAAAAPAEEDCDDCGGCCGEEVAEQK
jgi:hypothetical protein